MTGIYVLVEPARRPQPLEYVDDLLRAGVRLIQIRAKAGVGRDVLGAVVARVRAAGGRTIVNDDIEAALAADGVHLGQEDAAGVDLGALRACLGARIIGLSCSTPAEARRAAETVDYIGAGPIFATGSKADAGGPIGVSGVAAVVAAARVPVVAIGGITPANLGRVRESGAAMAAVISAIADSRDPEATARALVAAWRA